MGPADVVSNGPTACSSGSAKRTGLWRQKQRPNRPAQPSDSDPQVLQQAARTCSLEGRAAMPFSMCANSSFGPSVM